MVFAPIASVEWKISVGANEKRKKISSEISGDKGHQEKINHSKLRQELSRSEQGFNSQYSAPLEGFQRFCWLVLRFPDGFG